MKKTLLFFAVIILWTSCKNTSYNELELIREYVDLSEQAVQIDSNTGEKYYAITSAVETYKPVLDYVVLRDTAYDFDPFKDYVKRDFYKGVAAKYALKEIPGHIFRKNSDGSLTRVSIKRVVVNNAYPDVTVVDKVYFNNKITNEKTLKAAAFIAKVELEKKQIAELILKDETSSYLPDKLFDEQLINTLASKIDESEIDQYYLANGAVISSITSKFFRSNKFNKKIEANWITAERNSYNSFDNFKLQVDVSVELISLKDYLL